MGGPLVGKRRSRLLEEIEELRQEVERHRDELTTLELLQKESRTRRLEFDSYEGTCAGCGEGAVVRIGDTLRCTSCEYQRYL